MKKDEKIRNGRGQTMIKTEITRTGKTDVIQEGER